MPVMPAATKETLKREVHGEGVVTSRLCDYCGAHFEIDDPVQYDVLRVGDMANLKAMIPAPVTWLPDAARCHDCEVDTIEPATDGFDEALVSLTINDSNGVLSVDTTTLTVVDFSPDGDGYQPPLFSPTLVTQRQDLGLVRWIRIEQLLALDTGESDIVEIIRSAAEQSPEIPPGLDIEGN